MRVLVFFALVGCTTEEPPAACKAHRDEVCIACGNGSKACRELGDRMRNGLRDKMLNDDVCREGFERHHATVAAIGGITRWCDMENKKQ